MLLYRHCQDKTQVFLCLIPLVILFKLMISRSAIQLAHNPGGYSRLLGNSYGCVSWRVTAVAKLQKKSSHHCRKPPTGQKLGHVYHLFIHKLVVYQKVKHHQDLQLVGNTIKGVLVWIQWVRMQLTNPVIWSGFFDSCLSFLIDSIKCFLVFWWKASPCFTMDLIELTTCRHKSNHKSDYCSLKIQTLNWLWV